MKLNDRVYEILKWISLVALDGIGVFYRTIAEIWKLPYGDEVLATCTAISLLIGTLIGISTLNYRLSQKDEENK